MKIRNLLLMSFLCCAVLLCMTGCFKNIKRKSNNIKDINKFYFSYSTSNYIYGSVSYDIALENEKYILTIKLDNVAPEDADKIEINNTILENVLAILNKYQVKNWNGFNKSDSNVLDGNSFNMSITEKDETHISAHGYMMWPENYREVKQELDELFKNILDENKEN